MTAVPAEAAAAAEGYEAIAAGEWERARAAFEVALAAGDSPEALDGLGRALWWNLSKIYRKLGVSSRTELAARIAAITPE